MALRSYLDEACDQIDAAIFSGDVLHVPAERAELKEYLQRWVRELTRVENQEAHDNLERK